MQFRHELKHEISVHDMMILRQRLRAVMRPDTHTVPSTAKTGDCIWLWKG